MTEFGPTVPGENPPQWPYEVPEYERVIEHPQTDDVGAGTVEEATEPDRVCPGVGGGTSVATDAFCCPKDPWWTDGAPDEPPPMADDPGPDEVDPGKPDLYVTAKEDPTPAPTEELPGERHLTSDVPEGWQPVHMNLDEMELEAGRIMAARAAAREEAAQANEFGGEESPAAYPPPQEPHSEAVEEDIRSSEPAVPPAADAPLAPNAPEAPAPASDHSVAAVPEAPQSAGNPAVDPAQDAPAPGSALDAVLPHDLGYGPIPPIQLGQAARRFIAGRTEGLMEGLRASGSPGPEMADVASGEAALPPADTPPVPLSPPAETPSTEPHERPPQPRGAFEEGPAPLDGLTFPEWLDRHRIPPRLELPLTPDDDPSRIPRQRQSPENPGDEPPIPPRRRLR